MEKLSRRDYHLGKLSVTRNYCSKEESEEHVKNAVRRILMLDFIEPFIETSGDKCDERT